MGTQVIHRMELQGLNQSRLLEMMEVQTQQKQIQLYWMLIVKVRQ